MTDQTEYRDQPKAHPDLNTCREVAARIWCDPAYSHVVMDVEKAEWIARVLSDRAEPAAGPTHHAARVYAYEVESGDQHFRLEAPTFVGLMDLLCLTGGLDGEAREKWAAVREWYIREGLALAGKLPAQPPPFSGLLDAAAFDTTRDEEFARAQGRAAVREGAKAARARGSGLHLGDVSGPFEVPVSPEVVADSVRPEPAVRGPDPSLETPWLYGAEWPEALPIAEHLVSTPGYPHPGTLLKDVTLVPWGHDLTAVMRDAARKTTPWVRVVKVNGYGRCLGVAIDPGEVEDSADGPRVKRYLAPQYRHGPTGPGVGARLEHVVLVAAAGVTRVCPRAVVADVTPVPGGGPLVMVELVGGWE